MIEKSQKASNSFIVTKSAGDLLYAEGLNREEKSSASDSTWYAQMSASYPGAEQKS